MAERTAPTNDRIVDMLESILRELDAIRREQQVLAEALRLQQSDDQR